LKQKLSEYKEVNMRRIALFALMTCLVPFLAAAPANAQATRTWVSGVGDDANPCSRTAPCKTFAGAISKTAGGGEINCLDPGGFGALTITKSINISCEVGTAGVLVSGTPGITIAAGANDVVTLKGLDFQGLSTGTNGINFVSGKSLLVDKCVINNFSTNGIIFQPSGVGTLVVTNTVVANNGGAAGAGIKVSATASGFARAFLRNVTADRNFIGIQALGNGTTSAINVVDSSVTASGSNGLSATGTGASIKVGSSYIIASGAAATSGAVTSFGNNEIIDNNPDTVPGSAGGLH
jgi:hypothetical protein